MLSVTVGMQEMVHKLLALINQNAKETFCEWFVNFALKWQKCF